MIRIAVTSFWLSPAVHASDTWTEIAPGVDHLHRTTSGDSPQDIHVVRVDLTQEHISIQASADVSGSERGVTTSTFADSIGATVAINADWSGADQDSPLSLAVANGVLWNEHYNDAGVGSVWGTFACDAFNRCESAAIEPLSTAWWFTSPGPLILPYRYFNAVGANGVLLIDDGERQSGCFDGTGCEGDTCQHPRTAICTTEDQSELYMMVIDGRSSSASGMTCGEVRDLAEELKCWDAAMLDGGGSSTMVIEGSVINDPSDGNERSRPNHIGIVVADSTDPECTVSAGRWCDGTEISTCSGGRYLGSGDCAAYGATCEEDGDWAYCVNYLCPDGDGMGSNCLDETQVESCVDGVYADGDCAFFGMVCGEDSQGAACMDSRCEAGPSSSFCVDASTIGACTEGVYEESTCPSDESCESSGETATCGGPEDTGDPEPEPEDTGDEPGTDTDDGTSGEASGGEEGQDEDTDSAQDGDEGDCGCASTSPGFGGLLWGLALLPALCRRRP